MEQLSFFTIYLLAKIKIILKMANRMIIIELSMEGGSI